MTHIWVRAEQRANEDRVGITPDGAAKLIESGIDVTVEQSQQRVIPIEGYKAVGCKIAPEHSWPDAPKDAIIFGLKELPEDGSDLPHQHIMFGHAFKGQFSGQTLLKRFKAGGGTLLDLEYLVDDTGRRVAAFGYWAGFAGAAVSLMAWAAQKRGEICPAISAFPNKETLLSHLNTVMSDTDVARPSAIVIGALGRVGHGASDLLEACGLTVTKWDLEETQHGGPFPEIGAHDLFINCILARPGTPVFVPSSILTEPRQLSVIGDVACDPDSDYNPVPLYHEATTWAAPVLRVAKDPVLDVMAIDNLPSMLPLESSEDFAAQLLPSLLMLGRQDAPVWQQAKTVFQKHMAAV